MDNRCPGCGYAVGDQLRCPECGLTKEAAQSATAALPRAVGLFTPFRHPFLVGKACAWPGLVPTSRAAEIAVTWVLLVVAAWPLMRHFGGGIALAFAWPLAEWWSNAIAHPDWYRRLGVFALWQRLWMWEAWSVFRWLLLFTGLAIGGAMMQGRRTARPPQARGPLNAALHRVLMFAPWIVALELGFLVGVWFHDPAVVPEPSTLFGTARGWSWTIWLKPSWLVRGILPTLAVGYVFFRSVFDWRPLAAAVAAITLVPIAPNLSVAWSVFYLKLFV